MASIRGITAPPCPPKTCVAPASTSIWTSTCATVAGWIGAIWPFGCDSDLILAAMLASADELKLSDDGSAPAISAMGFVILVSKLV